MLPAPAHAMVRTVPQRGELLVALIVGAAIGGHACTAHANETTAELRFQLFTPTFGWSRAPIPNRFENKETRGVSIVPGLGVRVFPGQLHHGLLVDFEWIDFDFSSYRTPKFALGHVGYGYRFQVDAVAGRRWLLTPHASLVIGGQTLAPDRSFTIGGRIGFDVDLHLKKRFFFGWSLSYQALKPTQGLQAVSQLVSWNVLPLRIGVDLGKAPPFSTASRSATQSTSSARLEHGVSEVEIKRAHSGRILLAVGVPVLAAGTFALALGPEENCGPHDPPLGTVAAGAALGAVGLGLTSAGIAILVRASKAARAVPMTKRRRRGLIVAATLTTIGSIAVIAPISTINALACANN